MNSTIAKRLAHLAIATTLVAGLTVNHASAAAPTQVATSVVVRYADLDLSRPKDARILYDRLHAAARLVCRDSAVVLDDLEHLRKYHDCIDRAMANAVTNVGAATVTAIREAQTR
jgi:UrcA family protein